MALSSDFPNNNLASCILSGVFLSDNSWLSELLSGLLCCLNVDAERLNELIADRPRSNAACVFLLTDENGESY